MKLLAVALGVIFAYDLYVFAQAQLLHGMEQASWEARGLVTALTVPMLAIAARRNPEWSLNIFVSRQVVFYTASLMGIGVYLVVMAFGGYLVALLWRHLGPGRAARVLRGRGHDAGGAAGVVGHPASSQGVHRQALLPQQVRLPHRVAALHRDAVGARRERRDAGGESADPYVRAIRAIARSSAAPAASCSCATTRPAPARRGPRGRAPPSTSRRLPVLAADTPMVRFLESKQWVIDVEEHRLTPDVYDNLELPALFDPPCPHRLVLPLLDDANLVGVLVLAEPPPPFRPTYEDRDLLKTVGRHVATHIAQHESDRRLAESRQFEAYHRLTAFVMHDLKNLAAQLSLIVSNAERHKRNPEFVDDAISTVAQLDRAHAAADRAAAGPRAAQPAAHGRARRHRPPGDRPLRAAHAGAAADVVAQSARWPRIRNG